jgi:hypothetical protein
MAESEELQQVFTCPFESVALAISDPGRYVLKDGGKGGNTHSLFSNCFRNCEGGPYPQRTFNAVYTEKSIKAHRQAWLART